MHGLSCLTACRILGPQAGIEPTSPELQGGFLTTGPSGKSLYADFVLSVSPPQHACFVDAALCSLVLCRAESGIHRFVGVFVE